MSYKENTFYVTKTFGLFIFDDKDAIRRILRDKMDAITYSLAVETYSVSFEKIAEIKRITIEGMSGCKVYFVYPMQPILALEVEDYGREFPRVFLKVISGEHIGWMVVENWMLLEELKITSCEPMEPIKR